MARFIDTCANSAAPRSVSSTPQMASDTIEPAGGCGRDKGEAVILWQISGERARSSGRRQRRPGQWRRAAARSHGYHCCLASGHIMATECSWSSAQTHLLLYEETGDLVTSCALERGPEITEDRFRSASSGTKNRRAEAASWGASGAMMAAQVNEDAWEMEAVGLFPRQTLKQGLRR